ncbi:hypothetical protein FOL47_000184 [Perkinsus chesapeaki]|uniref:Amidase domain-containing protein n=1 Tax=Perkinsus chesapeaki TaxID=330153 RepID=A0A7J6KWQ7_PERCH|nr:hypothetical protein FOL47_000184 [Perkinsus chesapeaki]
MCFSLHILSLLLCFMPGVRATGSYKCNALNVLDFNMRPISAPTATGKKLGFIAWWARKGLLGKPLRSYMLNSNGIQCIPEVAKEVSPEIAPVKFPMIALSDEDYEKAQEYYSKEEAQLKKNVSRYFGSGINSPYRSIEDLHTAYMKGKANPVDIIDNVLQAVRDFNPTLKAFKELYSVKEINRLAKASAERFRQGKPKSMLDGIPFGVKDEMNVIGQKLLDGINPKGRMAKSLPIKTTNDPVIDALLDAGAILIGTTTMHELGISPLGYNSWYQGPLNAFDTRRFTGGSSSGAATAAAAGMALFFIGFDGGGSIRIPSVWSGVVGLAPTFGRVRYDNEELKVFTTLHCGPIAANVADVAHVMSVIGNVQYKRGQHFYDGLYQKAAGKETMPPMHLNALLTPSPKGKYKVGVFDDWVKFSSEEAQSAFNTALEAMKDQWDRHEFRMKDMQDQALSHTFAIATEFADTHPDQPLDGYEYNTQISLALGRDIVKKKDVVDAIPKLRGWAIQQWNEVFKGVDFIITPTIAYGAPEIPSGVFQYGEFNPTRVSEMLRFIWPTNLVGFPSITIPVGQNKEGMPLGIQIMAPHWQDDKLIKVGLDVQRQLAGGRIRPEKYYRDIMSEQ